MRLTLPLPGTAVNFRAGTKATVSTTKGAFNGTTFDEKESRGKTAKIIVSSFGLYICRPNERKCL